ncbi:regulatory protein, Fis family [Pseudobutyrivibrio sp. OR37]|uniref:helix-turn-helix domain-containing protein n=1 Tax=Pseudobutyrivibrio sp. OR37 TaxID=1798186 RepID=UPI0008F15CB0|nr:helix-turn-helix domain-containing protein [Pseudobutyrivibrio sp. OR37]SFI19425.1 regulatory protein, Fis family [Pseudobutyrivibrio sp. OR37]
MIKTNELRGRFAAKGYSQKEIADMLGISTKTLYLKMKSGIFGSDEIQIMIDKLEIENPMDIFFAHE